MTNSSTPPLALAGPSPLFKYADLSKALDPKSFDGHGDVSSEELYGWVGRSLSMFEKIQDEVVALFDQLCGGTFGAISPMGQIIGATSSFNVKMELTRQAAKSFVPDEAHKAAILQWLKLANKASLVRNKIAHGQPVHANFVVDGESRSGAFWAPSLRDTKKVGWPNTRISDWEYAWTARQIREYNEAFHLVYAMLLTLREELAGVGTEETADVLDPERM